MKNALLGRDVGSTEQRQKDILTGCRVLLCMAFLPSVDP